MTVRPNSLAAIDAANVLHPFTNPNTMRRQGGTIITGGHGVYIVDETGKEYIEGMAGLGCVSLGWGEHRLADAAAAAMRKMPYYHQFFMRGNESSALLAEKLLAMAPAKFSKVFFTSSGSEANDTVLKMLRYANNALGRPRRKKVIGRLKSYHGVTLAAASLSGLPNMHAAFDLPIDGILHTNSPYYYREARADEFPEQFASRMAENLDLLIRHEGADTIAAFMTEPLQSAGGNIIPPPTYWAKIQAVLKRHAIPLVIDEVITGFGRTGPCWASQTYGITPDILVCAKAITSAYQPLGAVMINEEFYQAIAKGADTLGAFAHGFTYSGHPVACAVALETLKIYEERDIFAHTVRVGEFFQRELATLADHPLVGEVRGVGLVGGVELVRDKGTREAFDPAAGLDPFMLERLLHHGVIARTGMGNLGFLPPLIINEAEIKELVRRVRLVLDDSLAWVEERGLRRLAAAE